MSRIVFHTIAIEPARWTPARVSSPLVDVLQDVHDAGFQDLEVFEPHLIRARNPRTLKLSLDTGRFNPLILGSYLDLNPAVTSDKDLELMTDAVFSLVSTYGFSMIRLFAGAGMSPHDREGLNVFRSRLRRLVDRLPGTEVLLESHDGSLADDPEVLAGLVEDFSSSRLGILYQPTFFDNALAFRQFQRQKKHIRHVHLQGRKPDLSFVGVFDGVVNWEPILSELDSSVGVSIEFVPSGICPPEEFDLAKVLAEMVETREKARAMLA